MVIYTPLDIRLKLPKYEDVLKYVKDNYLIGLDQHTGYKNLLCPIAVPFFPNDWRNPKEIFSDMDLKNFERLNFAPNLLNIFPEIMAIIQKFPYQKLYGIFFNLHTEPLLAHHDVPTDSNPPDLDRINILISPHYEKNSFFLQKTLESAPIYPTILKDYPAYAFNDTIIYHGADPVLDNRIIIVFIGILDKEKYSVLVNNSIQKFKKYVIEV